MNSYTRSTICYLIVFLFIGALMPIGAAMAQNFGVSPDTTADPPVLSDPTPCRDLLLEVRSIDIQPGRLGNSSGKVPVYDEWVIRNLISLGEAIQRSYKFSELQDEDVQSTKEYLRLLCQKEYEEDQTLQHAWRNVIDEFVNQTYQWVLFAYNGNPIFVQNLSVYNQLIDDEVLITFLKDIVISSIGNDTKRKIVKRVLRDRFEQLFPFNVQGSPGYDPTRVLSADGVADSLDDNFVALGGFDALQKLAQPGNSGEATVELAQGELERRINERREYENQKLDWGRGFFSYEYCNYGDGNADGQGELGLFSDTREDRRNCYIVTPGSLIQDQVSFVFGSALRQMELNDEYQEWIGQTSFEVLASVNSNIGLDNLQVDAQGIYDSYVRTGSPRVVDPQTILTELQDKTDIDGPNYVGPDLNTQQDLFPTEFRDYIDPTTSTKNERDDALLQRILNSNIPLIN